MNGLSKVEFHVDHNVKPRHIEEILSLLKKGILITKKTFLSQFNSYGYTIHQRHLGKNLLIFRYFGIIKSQNKAFSLTQLGLSLEKRLNSGRDVFYDLMQYLYCTARDFGDRKRTHFSWSYKTTFDLLWERKSTVVNRKKLAGELLAAAQEEFGSRKISISHEAIRGIFNWLSALDPPFVKDTRKRTIGSGRACCSPELFILAIHCLYHMLDLSHKVPVLLDDSKKELINKLCLLKEDSFIWMSDSTIKTFDFVHKHYGEWGTSLILQKRVKSEDLD